MLNTRMTTCPTVNGDAIVDELDEDSFQGFNYVDEEQSTPRRHGPIPRHSFHPYHQDHLRPELRPSSSSSFHWDAQSYLSETEFPAEYHGGGGSTEYHGGGGGSTKYHGSGELSQNPLSRM